MIGNMNFEALPDREKNTLLKLLKEYKHFANRWTWQKKKEVEEKLSKYGLFGI